MFAIVNAWWRIQETGREETTATALRCYKQALPVPENSAPAKYLDVQMILAASDKRDTIPDPLTNPGPIGTTRPSQQRRPDCHHKQSYHPVAVYFDHPSWSSRRADSKSIVLSRKFQEQQQLCNKTFPPPSDAPTKVVVAVAADLSG
uniref:(northern house mosquito) hypothetical protein n=1 Tax=Culex pipiens TaxID=7175 RepID=A0A8D8NF67_CULPI